MLKWLFLKIGVLIIYFLIPHTSVHAQYFNVFDIETSEYPIIRAKYIFEEDGIMSSRHFSLEELKVKENGHSSSPVAIHPPAIVKKQSLSVVLAFDVSSSMVGDRLQIAKEAGKLLIEKIDTEISEVAVSSFDHMNYLNCDFTGNKSELREVLLTLEPLGGTDYNSGFHLPFGGALDVARKGSYKRVVIFMTDGKGEGDEEKIIQMANQHDIVVYPVTIKMDMPELLKSVAEETGGKSFGDIQSVEEAKAIYEEILMMAGTENFGELVWKSPAACKKQVKVDLELAGRNIQTTYELKQDQIARLIADPRFLIFEENTRDTLKRIQLVAQNAEFRVEDIQLEQPGIYQIKTPEATPFVLSPNEASEITLEKWKEPGKALFTNFQIKNSQCPDLKVYIKDGQPGVEEEPIRLVTPNGGEFFSAGTQAKVAWENVGPEDSVTLFFSSNNGVDWHELKTTAGLQDTWKVPAITGHSNLMKVTLGRSQEKNVRLVLLNELHGTDYSAHHAAFSRKGNFILTSEDDNSIRLWDAGTGQYIQKYQKHNDWVYSTESDWEEKILLSASEDGTARLFDLNSGQGLKILKAGTWSVNKAIFTPDYSQVITVSDDGIIRVWSHPSGQLIYRLISHPGWIMDVDVSLDSKRMVTANDDMLIRIWDVENRSHLMSLRGHNDWVYDVDFSPGGNYIVSASKDGSFDLWNAYTGKLLRRNTEHNGKVFSANFSPDGKYIITASRDGTIRLWDTYDGSLIDLLMAEDQTWFRQAEFDSRGNRVVGTDSEGNAYVWLLKKREPFQEDMSDKNFTIVSPKPAFHDIQMGDQRVGTFRDSLLKNYFYLGGQFPSTIEEVTLVGAHEKDYRIVSGFTAGTMKPGEYYDLELSFQPQETGVRKARLRVVTPTDTLFSEITGTGLAQSYHIPSRYIDMGSVRVGKSKDSLASILENTGTLPVTLTGLRMEGPAFEYFSMDGNSNAVILKPGDKFRVPLRFHPEKAGRHNAVLSFSAGNSSYREKISLFGEGTVPEEIQLQGSVLSQSDSLPLEAEVEVFETGETTPVAQLQTLANGKFEFQLKRGHTYRIAAEKEKYIPEGVHIAIRKNETRSSLHRNIYLSPIRKGSKVRLDNVFFDFASAELLDQSYGELNRVVRFLKENPAVTIRVEGHTDHTGSDDYNMKLSKNRAEAVKNYLISQGVDSRRIQVKGYGESQPVAENSTAKGRAKNRRVEFVILSN